MKNNLDPQIIEFLNESNAIENVWDSDSLDQAVKAWKYIIRRSKLTIQNILNTHAILMKGKLDKDNLGKFRREQVWIGGHEAKPWYAVPELMIEWTKNANQLPKTEDEIKEDHIKGEEIHGFLDGNGRLYRILMGWQRMKSGLPIKIIYNDTKFIDYYRWFK